MPRTQARANRYVAELISATPPDELISEKESPADQLRMLRILDRMRERLLIEADLLESMPDGRPTLPPDSHG